MTIMLPTWALAIVLNGSCHSPDQCLVQLVMGIVRCVFGCL